MISLNNATIENARAINKRFLRVNDAEYIVDLSFIFTIFPI